MLKCECGGILVPIAIEQFPPGLSNKEKMNYGRVCDVQCQSCGKTHYSQPYDDYGSRLKQVKKTEPLKFKDAHIGK